MMTSATPDVGGGGHAAAGACRFRARRFRARRFRGLVQFGVPNLPDRLSASRLLSLDVFRGLTIAAMILVNNPGNGDFVYPALQHAPWHGWTPADLIFPFFLVIVGVSLVLSQERRLARGDSRAAIARRIVVRSALLIAIGVALNYAAHPELATLRYAGVLQRIGLVYLVTAMLALFTSEETQRWVVAFLLVGYSLLLTRVAVPTLGAPSIDPGSNLPSWLDLRLLGAAHMWTPTIDPEGILSTAPAIATGLIGALAGRWLVPPRAEADRAAGLLVAGQVLLVLGMAWDSGFPINKNLWTSSYVLFTAGAALSALGVLHWIVEVRGRRRWARPFEMFGTNALLAFVLSTLLGTLLVRLTVNDHGADVTLQDWIYAHLFADWAGTLDGSLAFAAATVLFWLAVMAVLHRRRWFVKL